MGWVGYRSSIGVSDETFINYNGSTGYLNGDDAATHEIGHNFGRMHTAGCGAANTDPNYPYPYGLIGQFGFRFSDQFLVPKTYNDIMNYCDNQWISDYTYKALLNDQLRIASLAALAPQESLYIRLSLEEDGSVSFKPIYSFSVSPDLEVQESEYSLQLMNEAGEVVTEQPVRIFTAQEQDLSIRAIRTALPLPDKPFNTLRLMHQGAEIGRHSFQQTELAASQALSAENQDETLTLSWGDIQTPALVRYSSDGGATWTTLGVDVTGGKFSYGLADLPTAPPEISGPAGRWCWKLEPGFSRIKLPVLKRPPGLPPGSFLLTDSGTLLATPLR